MRPREQKNNAPFCERIKERFIRGHPPARAGLRCFVLHSSFILRRAMSYLSTALQRRAELRRLNQTDVAKHSGISRSFVSRLFSGELHDMSDANFVALLNVFAADPQAQAEIIVARCLDTLEIARAAKITGASLVEIAVKSSEARAKSSGIAMPLVNLAEETERAFAWLRSQCPLNPDLEKHLVGYAKLTGMK
jgi:transcriptional regulator with XRE-family HTH domain